MIEQKNNTNEQTSDMKRNNIKRDLVISGTHIHVISIFNGKIPLEKAMCNVVMRKISESKTELSA